MINFEPLPLMEAHFFLAGKQAGFRTEDYFRKKAIFQPDIDFPDENHIKALIELESRLSDSMEISEHELSLLYRDLGSSEGDPAFPGTYFVANLLIGSLQFLADEKNCFNLIREKSNAVIESIAIRLNDEAPENEISQTEIFEEIMVSELSDESKLLLIDVVLHTNKYIDLLERALLPVAEEFKKCTQLIQPLLTHFKNHYSQINTPKEESKLFRDMLQQSTSSDSEFDIYPMLSYFYIIVFNFVDKEHKKIFGGIGVLYDSLKKFYHTDVDVNSKLSSIMNVLGSKSRFDILVKLSEAPQYGRELAAFLGVTPATVSHHINALLAEGLIKLDTTGKRVYYSLNYDCIESFVGMLQKLLCRK